MPISTTSIGGTKVAKPAKAAKAAKVAKPAKAAKAATKSTGGYNLAPLVSALLLAGIKLSLLQNKKLTDKRKSSTPKPKTKSMPRPNTV